MGRSLDTGPSGQARRPGPEICTQNCNKIGREAAAAIRAHINCNRRAPAASARNARIRYRIAGSIWVKQTRTVPDRPPSFFSRSSGAALQIYLPIADLPVNMFSASAAAS